MRGSGRMMSSKVSAELSTAMEVSTSVNGRIINSTGKEGFRISQDHSTKAHGFKIPSMVRASKYNSIHITQGTVIRLFLLFCSVIVKDFCLENFY